MILLQTSPCDQSECQNDAQCLVVEGEPVCRCLPGFTGNKCHKIVTVHLLGKGTYLELPSVKIRNSVHISLQVLYQPLPLTPNSAHISLQVLYQP